MRVLSLFDGLGGARIALDKLNFECEYFSSEIDPYAESIAKKNYPDIISLGDARGIDLNNLPKIDLMIAGFPCQDLSQNSVAGKGLKGEKSKLFYTALNILQRVQPTYFLFENVIMSKENQDKISSYLGFQPVKQNSSEVSAQLRSRLYWTNFGFSQFTTDDSPCLGDIMDWDGSYDGTCKMREFRGSKKTKWIAISPDKSLQRQRVYCPSGKSPCVNTHFPPKVYVGALRYRKLTIEESEKLQTIPVGYTAGVSKTQRIKMLGNSFTAEIISRILSPLLYPQYNQLSLISYCNNFSLNQKLKNECSLSF